MRKGRVVRRKTRPEMGEPAGDQVAEFRYWILEMKGIFWAVPEVQRMVISPKRVTETTRVVTKWSNSVLVRMKLMAQVKRIMRESRVPVNPGSRSESRRLGDLRNVETTNTVTRERRGRPKGEKMRRT